MPQFGSSMVCAYPNHLDQAECLAFGRHHELKTEWYPHREQSDDTSPRQFVPQPLWAFLVMRLFACWWSVALIITPRVHKTTWATMNFDVAVNWKKKKTTTLILLTVLPSNMMLIDDNNINIWRYIRLWVISVSWHFCQQPLTVAFQMSQKWELSQKALPRYSPWVVSNFPQMFLLLISLSPGVIASFPLAYLFF